MDTGSPMVSVLLRSLVLSTRTVSWRPSWTARHSLRRAATPVWTRRPLCPPRRHRGTATHCRWPRLPHGASRQTLAPLCPRPPSPPPPAADRASVCLKQLRLRATTRSLSPRSLRPPLVQRQAPLTPTPLRPPPCPPSPSSPRPPPGRRTGRERPPLCSVSSRTVRAHAGPATPRHTPTHTYTPSVTHTLKAPSNHRPCGGTTCALTYVTHTRTTSRSCLLVVSWTFCSRLRDAEDQHICVFCKQRSSSDPFLHDPLPPPKKKENRLKREHEWGGEMWTGMFMWVSSVHPGYKESRLISDLFWFCSSRFWDFCLHLSDILTQQKRVFTETIFQFLWIIYRHQCELVSEKALHLYNSSQWGLWIVQNNKDVCVGALKS